MSYRKQHGHMWGCRVVWRVRKPPSDPKWHEEWMWIMEARTKDGEAYYPIVFAETRSAIMPLVKEMREQYNVKSAKAVKVPIPELP